MPKLAINRNIYYLLSIQVKTTFDWVLLIGMGLCWDQGKAQTHSSRKLVFNSDRED